MDWTERLFYFIYLNYPWFSILDYVLAYYQLHQNSPPDSWFDPDPTLISYHLTLSQQRPSTVPSSCTGVPSAEPKSGSTVPPLKTSQSSLDSNLEDFE